MLSVNEEYRSTAEELETSKEELQSINEELQTVNTELKTKLESVTRARSDVQNLMAATDVGILFLDPPWIIVDWKESGIETVQPPAGSRGAGNGRRLIEDALPYQFGARTQFAIELDGVRCTIALPISGPQTEETQDGPSQPS